MHAIRDCPYKGQNWTQEEYLMKQWGYRQAQHFPVPGPRTPHWIEQAIGHLNMRTQHQREVEQTKAKLQTGAQRGGR